MRERILLSTHTIVIKNKVKEKQILGKFNGQEDFLDFFNLFLNRIFESVHKEYDIENKNVLVHLTLAEPPIIDTVERVIYGYFSSGISGDKFTVKDHLENTELLRFDPKKHASFREIFFYCQVPYNSKEGYLVLQRKAKFGIKNALSRIIRKYALQLNYMESNITINNVVPEKVFDHMIEKGNLKKIDFIKRTIPKSLELYTNNGYENNEMKGKLVTSFSSSNSLNDNYKDYIKGLFKPDMLMKNDKNTILVEELNSEYDEVEFELELQGKRKTFYVNAQNRILPDVDVTNELIYEGDEPTLSSLISKSKELIFDILIQKPNV